MIGAIPPPPRKFIEVTAAVTIKTERLAFADDYTGLEVIATAGPVVAHDGDDARGDGISWELGRKRGPSIGM